MSTYPDAYTATRTNNQAPLGSAPDQHRQSNSNKAQSASVKTNQASSYTTTKPVAGNGSGTSHPPPTYQNQTAFPSQTGYPSAQDPALNLGKMALVINEVNEMCNLAVEINNGLENLRSGASPDNNTNAWNNFYNLVVEHRTNMNAAKNLFTQIKTVLEGVPMLLGTSANHEGNPRVLTLDNTIALTVQNLPSSTSQTPLPTTINPPSSYQSTVCSGRVKQQYNYDNTPAPGHLPDTINEKFQDAYDEPYTSDANNGSQTNFNKNNAKGHSKMGLNFSLGRFGNSDPIPAYQKDIDKKIKKLKERCDDFSPKLKEALRASQTGDTKSDIQEIQRLMEKIKILNEAFSHFEQIGEPPIDGHPQQCCARSSNMN